MPDLRDQLREILQGRVCLVGVGNVAYGDDGLGVRLAEALGSARARAVFGASPNAISDGPCGPEPVGEGADRNSRGGCAPQVIVAGTSPERCVDQFARGAFDTVLFLDAVEFGAVPGSVVLLGSSEMTSRFPQVSTHKISLGLLAQLIEAGGHTKVRLLGVQPASVKPGAGISAAVAETIECLTAMLSALSPLTPALSPLRGEGDARQRSRVPSHRRTSKLQGTPLAGRQLGVCPISDFGLPSEFGLRTQDSPHADP